MRRLDLRLPTATIPEHPKLLQLGVFRFGSDEDGDFRVGVFPEAEEILKPEAGGACVRSIFLRSMLARECEPES